jgi:probable addiction module antidote protein
MPRELPSCETTTAPATGCIQFRRPQDRPASGWIDEAGPEESHQRARVNLADYKRRTERPFRDTQIEQLKDPASAALYLEEALAAGDTDAFKLALRNVVEARLGGMSALSERTELSREALYRSLSKGGNPTLATLTKVMQALGLRVSVAVETTDPRQPEATSDNRA